MFNSTRLKRTIEAYIEAANTKSDRWVYEKDGKYAIKEEEINDPQYKLVEHIETEFADNSPNMVALFAAVQVNQILLEEGRY